MVLTMKRMLIAAIKIIFAGSRHANDENPKPKETSKKSLAIRTVK